MLSGNLCKFVSVSCWGFTRMAIAAGRKVSVEEKAVSRDNAKVKKTEVWLWGGG